MRQKSAPPAKPASSPDNSPFLRKAFAFYEAFAAQNRDDPKSLWQIGMAAWRMGQIGAVLGDGERSEQASQTAMKIWGALGEALPPDAETRAQVAWAYNRRAQSCYERVEFDRAFPCYERCLQLEPNGGVLRMHFARALVLCPDPKFRNPQRAVALALEAARLQPGVADHWKALTEIVKHAELLKRPQRPAEKDGPNPPPR